MTEKTSPTRRQFLAAAAPAAAAAAVLRPADLAAQAAASIPSLRIPSEIPAALGEAPVAPAFEGNGMMGADVFAKLCKDEGLAAMFCCPGNYTVTHAIAAAGIPSYGGRTEGTMAAAADGYARATGEVVACSGTEGPGFTNMITSIASAYYARIPLLVLASNVQLTSEDRETGIQAMYQQPITEGIKKYGKRMILPNRVHEYGAYAFRELKTGVPGPVHLDFPGEVARQRFKDPGQLTDYYDRSKYRTESRAVPSAADVAKVVDLIAKAERPLLIAGHGVFHRKAWAPLVTAVEKNDIAVVTSGPMRGHFPDDHRLSASLSPRAFMSADLIVFVGQYSMPSPNEYRVNPDVKAVRVHPEGGDLGRNWPLELGVVGDELAFLEALANALPRRSRATWVSEVAAARKTYEDELARNHQNGVKWSADTGALHPSVIGKELHDFLYKGKIDPKQTLSGWGGFSWQRTTVPFLRAQSSGAGDRLPVSVRRDRSRPGDDDRRGDGGQGRHRPAAAVQRGAERLPHDRRRHGLHAHGARYGGEVQGSADHPRLQQQLLGHLDDDSRHAASGAPASLPGKHPLRPDRGEPRRVRRLRADAGRVARGAAAGVRRRVEAGAAGPDQRAGEEGIQFGARVPAGRRHGIRTRHYRLPALMPARGSRRATPRRARRLNPASAVETILRGYVDRGVFRSLGAGTPRGAQTAFTIVWHHGRSFRLIVDRAARTVSFPSVLPAIPARSPMLGELRRFTRQFTSAELPPHRRVDPAKGRLRLASRRAGVSLSLTVIRGEWEYCARRLVHIAHEIYMVFLPDGPYQEYRVEKLGLDPDAVWT